MRAHFKEVIRVNLNLQLRPCVNGGMLSPACLPEIMGYNVAFMLVLLQPTPSDQIH
jgi:hypothetical protein